jgi:hypothetical protein
MSVIAMQDPSRSAAQGRRAANPEPEPERARRESGPAPVGARPSKPPDNRFVGHAMKALFEASDVTIKRGDETRVMSRAQEALAEIQRKTDSNRPTSSQPPAEDELDWGRSLGPRVDAVLWIVLAAGLFAIAGWMLAYAL